ncbi:MAG: beta-lactamase family protein [Bacteroidetes bacterium]|nr:beta-lactamase family protein [Bacteroidota bacterium]
MNKNIAIWILLLMFLGCGNSGNINLKIKEKPSYTEKIKSNNNSLFKKLSTNLDTMFETMHSKLGLNACVLVAKGTTILYQHSFGYANKENAILLNDSSKFQLASVSKVITALAILILYEHKQIDLEKNIEFYLPDFPYKNITVKCLLNHRSGLPNYLYFLNSEIYTPNLKMDNKIMYEYMLAKNPKEYLKPNKRFYYCNTNYALLAMLVEKISNKPFNVFLKDEIFTPLGMKNSCTIADLDLNATQIAKPYDQRWRPVKFDASDYVLGDKSTYSTAYDMFLLSKALFENKIISKETQQLAYTPYSREKINSNYGFGWRMNNFKDSLRKEVYHNGWWHGYRTAFHRRLSDSVTVVILSNQLNKSAYQTYKVFQVIDDKFDSELNVDED